LARACERAPAETSARRRVAPQIPEKLVQMILERLETFLEQQEHEHRKVQHPLAREILGPPAMTRGQARFQELLAQPLDEMKSPLMQCRIISHPQCKSRMYLLCTFKKITKYS